MMKPLYKSDVYAFVFLALGLGFIFFGCLGVLNIVKPTAQSIVQDPILAGQIFFFLGMILCVIQLAFRNISIRQAKLHRELVSKGTKIVGTVEKISLQKGIMIGKKSPVIVYYNYLYDNKIYHNKSCLLWDLPNLSNGNKIDIFVNDNGQSTFEL